MTVSAAAQAPASVGEIFAITCNILEMTGRISYGFIFASNAPFDVLGACMNAWGILTRDQKSDDHVNPWKLVRGEPGAIGDDGVKRWNFGLFDQSGFLIQGGCDESPNEDGLEQLFRDALKTRTHFTLLLDAATFAIAKPVMERVGFDVKQHHFDGKLASS